MCLQGIPIVFWVLIILWLIAFIILLVLALLLCSKLWKQKKAGPTPDLEEDDEPEEIDAENMVESMR